ncbi:acyltransferase [Boseaceae bacterium BT-24-1]|nr:acyltransferase [Boseaceae bacterium BT-24-1]
MAELSGSAASSPHRRADIQWLRAIAAISVVAWHTDLIVKHVWNDAEIARSAAYNLLGGFGVELFFMLSGYSISLQVIKLSSPTQFLLTRAYKIYPLYFIFTLLMIAAYIANPSLELSARAENGFLFIFFSFLALPQAALPLLPLGWTLEMELVFYLMVAAAMATGVIEAAKSRLGWLLVAFGLVGFAIAANPSGGMVVFEMINPFMAAFGFGWLLHCRDAQPGRSSGAFAAAAIVVMLCLSRILPEREAACALRMALSGLIMVAVMRLEPYFQANPGFAWPGRVIGDASFSIYLSHWFVLSIAGKLLPHLSIAWMGIEGVRLLGILVSIAVGIGVHRLIEQRLGSWIALHRRNKRALSLDRA